MHIDKIATLARQIHQTAKDKGWWDEKRNRKEMFMLIITELSEAVEADREGRSGQYQQFSSAIETGDDFKPAFEMYIKDSIGDELADAFIRCLDFLYSRWGSRGIKEGFKDGKTMMGAIITDNFAESIFNICNVVTKEDIFMTIFLIQVFCMEWDIDLQWHVEQKMKYNGMRPEKHGGKKY